MLDRSHANLNIYHDCENLKIIWTEDDDNFETRLPHRDWYGT